MPPFGLSRRPRAISICRDQTHPSPTIGKRRTRCPVAAKIALNEVHVHPNMGISSIPALNLLCASRYSINELNLDIDMRIAAALILTLASSVALADQPYAGFVGEAQDGTDWVRSPNTLVDGADFLRWQRSGEYSTCLGCLLRASRA